MDTLLAGRLVETVAQARAKLEEGRERATQRLARGTDGGHKVAMLRRIRDIHQNLLLSTVQSRQRLVRDVGAVWLEEDIDRLHEMPRAVVHFRSLDAGLAAPRAYMTFHVAEDGTTFVSQNFVTPVKTTDVMVGRLDDLTPSRVERLVDEFLTKALGG